MTQTRVLLIRHAEPDEAARGRCYGRLDVGLSARGFENAAVLADRLRAVELVAVYTSPRRRAFETAAAICLTRAEDPVRDDGLRELDFGDFEGRSYEEIEHEQPEFFRRWMTSPTEVRFPGGEGYAELRGRASRAVEALRAAHFGQTFAVVSHGGVVRAALASLLRLPNERAFAVDVGYARISVVDWFDGTPIVRLMNATSADVPTLVGA